MKFSKVAKFLCLCTALFAGFQNLLCAQEPLLRWGSEQALQNTDVLFKLIPGHENEVIAVHMQNRKGDAFRFDRLFLGTMETSESGTMTLPTGPFHEVIDVVGVGGEAIAIFSWFDRKTRVHHVCASRFQAEVQQPDTIEIFQLANDSRSLQGKLVFAPSADGKSLLCAGISLQSGANPSTNYTLKCLSPNLEVLWKRDLVAPHRPENFRLEEVLLAHAGSVYLLASLSNPDFDRIQGRRLAKSYLLINLFQQSNEARELELSLGQKWIYDVRLCAEADTLVRVSGFYSNVADLSMSGTFSLQFHEPNGTLLAQGFAPFREEFTQYVRESKNDRFSNPELASYEMAHVLPLPNQDALLVAEEQFIRSSTYINPSTGLQTITYEYNYDDLIVARVNARGEVSSFLHFPKDQQFYSPYCTECSFGLGTIGNNTVFIYNDLEDNLKYSLDELHEEVAAVRPDSKMVAVLATVSPDGAVVRTLLYPVKDDGPVLYPGFSLPLDGRRLVFYTAQGDKFRMGMLEAEELPNPEN